MTDEWTDERPGIEPDLYGFRELPDDPADCTALWREMVDVMKAEGATWFRMTIVAPEYPRPPYPEGLYTEGWKVDPARMDPHGREARFNFPIVAEAPAP